MSKSVRLALLLACGGTPLAVAAPATAQTSYSPYAETAPAALARYVRTLASSPKDFSALVGAGRAALAVGDPQAAAGFFARADEVNPRSPLPQAGMGAVSVANGEPLAALPYFIRAQQLGAPVATFGADRGLAYDLLGRQAEAQADYRAALGGLDSDESRRRLALSLAISGNKVEALQALAPLFAKRDMAAYRCRAFVLALAGDNNGALAAIGSAMPGSQSGMAPFLQRLPMLQPGQKAAAVNLGIFPDSGGTAYAYSAPQGYSPPPASGTMTSVSADGLADIDNLLRAPAQGYSARQTQVAYSAPPPKRQAAAAPKPRKIWLQLASGPNADALPSEFKQIKSRNRDILDGIKGFVANSGGRSRLIIGPFRDYDDAETFAQGLDSVNAFRWTNSETDTIVPLGTD
jgi:tetratricopeptide (TPR) repeat protein